MFYLEGALKITQFQTPAMGQLPLDWNFHH